MNKKCLLVSICLLAATLCFAQNGVWKEVATLEQGRWACSANEIGSKIYLAGGILGDMTGKTTDELLVLDPVSNTFSTMKELPEPRHAHGTAVLHRKLYLVGGIDSLNALAKKTVFLYSPTPNTWEKLADFPIENCSFGIVALNNTIYVFGGSSKMYGATPYNTTFMYDYRNDIWEKMADMPTARAGFGVAVMDGKIYCMGGVASHEGAGNSQADFDWRTSIDVYDPDTDSWTTEPEMPQSCAWSGTTALHGLFYIINGYYSWNSAEACNPFENKWTATSQPNRPRAFQSVCTIGDSILYMFGGVANEKFELVPQVEMFKPDQGPNLDGRWETIAQMDIARRILQACVHDGKIFVTGGYGDVNLDKVSVFDPETGQFSDLPRLPLRRNGHGACFLNDNLYVFGGKTNLGSGSGSTNVWMFNSDSAKWINKAPMPVANCHFGITVYNNKAYIIGGAKVYGYNNGVHLNTLYVYDPGTDSWEQKADMLLNRCDVSAVTYNNRIWAMGGWIPGKEGIKVVEVYDPATDTWKRAKDMRYDHSGAAACVFKEHIYMNGGYLGEANVEAYNPTLNDWIKITKMNQPRAYHATCVVGDRIYGIGGNRRDMTPHSVSGIEVFSQVDTIDTEVAFDNAFNNTTDSYVLKDNYPNPFNPATTIAYNLQRPGNVKLTVYNALGKEVAELVNDFQVEGSHSATFDARHLPTGIYFYQLQIDGGYSEMKKMVLLK